MVRGSAASASAPVVVGGHTKARHLASGSLDDAAAELERRGWRRQPVFEIAHRPCCSFELLGRHRVAIYEATRPNATEHFARHRDF
jgi:hypothetical protein